MGKNNYDSKVIILDLDFTEIEQYNLDNILYLKKILSELSSNQNLIILTNNHHAAASKIVDELNLKSGYLITESGSITTNISTKNIMEEYELDKDLCIKICYKCIGSNLCFILSTDKSKYPFRINRWIISKYKLNPLQFYEYAKNMLENSSDLKKCIRENKVRKIEILFLEDNDEDRRVSIEKFINLGKEDENVNFSLNCSCLNINSKSKLEAIRKLANNHNGNLEEDSLYIGVGQFENEVAKTAKFSAITSEVKKCNLNNLPGDVEIIEWGEASGLNGLKDNAHIGTGNGEELLIKKLKSIKYKRQSNEIRGNNDCCLIVDNEGSKIRLNFGKEQINNVLEIMGRK